MRFIGIITAEQAEDGKTEGNDRPLGAAIHSYYNHEGLESIDDVSKTLLDQLKAFFLSYNIQRGKNSRSPGTGGPNKAMKFLKTGIMAHKKARKQ